MSARESNAPSWEAPRQVPGDLAVAADGGLDPLARAQRTPSISCVVPAYNESQNLPRLLPLLIDRLRLLTDRWEILVVDDGSRDATLAALQPWLTGGSGVVCLALSRNFGKEAALGAGLDHARGDVVVTLDADLQHPVELLEPMLKSWRAGMDMVYAVRASS